MADNFLPKSVPYGFWQEETIFGSQNRSGRTNFRGGGGGDFGVTDQLLYRSFKVATAMERAVGAPNMSPSGAARNPSDIRVMHDLITKLQCAGLSRDASTNRILENLTRRIFWNSL